MRDLRHNPILLVLGAGLLLAGGAIHTWLAFQSYGSSDLQKIFFVNGAASAVVATGVIVMRAPIAALAGVALSALSVVAFGMSRVGEGIAGFRAVGLEPLPEAPLTLMLEVAAAAILVLVLLGRRSRGVATATVRAD